MYSKKIADDGQRKCPKHVEFYSKNRFEKLVHLVGRIIRMYHDAWSPERQIHKELSTPSFDDSSRLDVVEIARVA